MRKFGVVIAAGLMAMALLATTAQASFEPQDDCRQNDGGLAPGVYPPSNPHPSGLGAFDLAFTPSEHGDLVNRKGIAQITGGAIACGTDSDSGRFFEDAIIYLPNKNEQVRCASPTNHGTYCANQETAQGGPYNDLGEGWLLGESFVDVYCDSGACNPRDQKDWAKIVTDYDTADSGLGFTGDVGPNRCTATAIQCAEARSRLFGVECNADVIYEPAPLNNPYQAKVQLHIYETHCADFNTDRQYLMAVKELKLCPYANKNGGGIFRPWPCGSPSVETGTNLNGRAGTWTYTLEARMNDVPQTVYTGTALITWT